MKPSIDHALTTFTGRFIEKIVPDIRSEFNQSETVTMATLLAVAAEDYDKAADVRVNEISAIKELFRNTECAERGLSERLDALVAKEPVDYRISNLQALVEELNAALIDLHAWADEQDPSLSVRIWSLLKDLAWSRRIELMG